MEFDQPPKKNRESTDDKETKKRKRKRRAARVPLEVKGDKIEAVGKKEKPTRKKKEKSQPKEPEETKVVAESEAPSKEAKSKEDDKQTPEDTYPDQDVTEPESALDESAESSHEVEEHAPSSPAELTEEVVLPVRQAPEHEEELFVSDRLRRLQEMHQSQAAAELNEEEELTNDVESHTQSTTSQAGGTRQTTRKRKVRTASSPGSTTQSSTVPPAMHTGVFTTGRNPTRQSRTPETTASSARETNEQLYYVERNGARRGVLSGLLLGAMIEHFRHKKREKKLQTRLKDTEKNVKKLEANEQYLQKEMAKNERAAGRRKTALERQIERLRAVPVAVPTKENAPIVVAEKEKSHAPTPESPFNTSETKKDVFEASSPFNSPFSTEAASKSRAAESKREEKINPEIQKAKQAVEQAIENQVITVPEGHRLQTSAWHTIEVDKKTGRAAENSSIEYGEEFKHEQHQEQLRQPSDEASQAGNSNSQGQGQQSNYELFQQATTPKLLERATSGKPKKEKQLSPPSLHSFVSDTEPIDIALWLVLLVVIIAIIIAL